MRQLFILALVSTAVSGQFNCPSKDGTFEDTRQCDKYYECYDGIPEERLCPDGLVFDPFSNKREPCDHYFNVDCGDRLELQTPKGPNDLCPSRSEGTRLNSSHITISYAVFCLKKKKKKRKEKKKKK